MSGNESLAREIIQKVISQDLVKLKKLQYLAMGLASNYSREDLLQ